MRRIQTREWLSLTSLVGVIFIGLLISSSERDHFQLRDWQPLIAALVAVAAAGLAYKASMEKVTLDRTLAEEVRRREVVGLYLQLSFAARLLQHELDQKRISMIRPTEKPYVSIYAYRCVLGPLPETWASAWDKIALFPPDVARAISQIKVVFYNFDLVFKSPDQEFQIPSIGPSGKDFTQIWSAVSRGIVECKTVREALRIHLAHLNVRID